MPTETYSKTTALVCNDNVCYNLKDILRNPNNKCNKETCKKIESDYADFMHLSIPTAYFYASSMYEPTHKYEERIPHEVALIIDEKTYNRIIEPSLEEDFKKKTVSNNKKNTKKKDKRILNKKTKKNIKNN